MVYLPENLGCTKFITHHKNNMLQFYFQIIHLEGAFQGIFWGVYLTLEVSKTSSSEINFLCVGEASF